MPEDQQAERPRIIINAQRPWGQKVAHAIAREFGANGRVRVDTTGNLEGEADALRFLIGVGEIIPVPQLERARDAGGRVFCVHPSRLPDYRGGSPLQHQIMDGLTSTAVSIFEVLPLAPVDSGPIAWQGALDLTGMISDVLARLEHVAYQGVAHLIREHNWDRPIATFPQAEGGFARSRYRHEDYQITLEEIRDKGSHWLYNKIRACAPPYPGAFLITGDGRYLYLTDAKIGGEVPPGWRTR